MSDVREPGPGDSWAPPTVPPDVQPPGEGGEGGSAGGPPPSGGGHAGDGGAPSSAEPPEPWDLQEPGGLEGFWWATAPAFGGRLFASLPQFMTDGSWATGYRPIARFGPPAMMLLGLLIGAFGLLYDTVPSESVLLLLFMVALGGLGGGLAFWYLAGYVLGDFFIANAVWGGDVMVGSRTRSVGIVEQLWTIRPGLLVVYTLFGVGMVVLAPLAKSVAAESVLRGTRFLAKHAGSADPFQVSGWFLGGVGALLYAGLMFAWAHGTALLIRPRYTLFGTSPTPGAIEPLQELAWAVALTAGLMFLLRYFLQGRVAKNDTTLRRAAAMGLLLEDRYPTSPALLDRVPWPLRLVLGTALLLMIGAGVVETWPGRIVVGAALLIMGLARSPLVPLSLVRRWAIVARLPLLVRIVIVAIVARIGAEYALEVVGRPRTWAPLLLPTAVTVLFALVLFPPVHRLAEEDPGADDLVPPQPPDDAEPAGAPGAATEGGGDAR